MLGCFRRDDALDPETFSAAVAATLAEFPESVVRHVTNPVRGLPGKLKWLPSVAEVREACEAEMAPIRREQERRARYDATQRLIAAPRPEQQPREHRASREELQAKCGGDSWGIDRGKAEAKRRFLTSAELRASIGMTEDAWNALPDARDR